MCRSGTSRSPLSLVVGEGGRRKDGGKLYISTVLPNGVCYSTATILTLASTATIRTQLVLKSIHYTTTGPMVCLSPSCLSGTTRL